MGRLISVDELQSLAEYEKARNDERRKVIAMRKRRRVDVGDKVTMQFENRETLLFQIHELIRAEGITDPDTLAAECDVYNALLPNDSSLSATLSVNLPENAPREEITKLAGLGTHASLKIGDSSVSAELDGDAEPGASVAHLRFALDNGLKEGFRDPGVDVVLQIDHPNYQAQAAIPSEFRQTIAEDLS